ncbi:MAG: metallophosphoesterase family protein, partial [Clostridiales bacterium]|nr:metallophosphoesterase family protein [Clostridiales bacterium]
MKKKKGFMTKVISLALALTMALGLCMTSAFADAATAEESEYYTVTFVTDEHVTVDIYYTKDASKNNTENPDETNVTTAIARESETGEADVSGTGQVNFRVNVDEGYEYAVTAEPESNYKTLKGKDDTGVEDVWRVSKMTGDVTVTITATAEKDAASEIDEATVWSYLDDGTDPAEGYEDRTAWTLASYDVSGWSSAAGSFGAKNGVIASLGTSGSADYTPDNLLTQYKEDGETDIEAYFFRTQVYVEDADAVTQILGSVIYDDAATIYVNGVKIAGFDDDDITENLQYGGSNAGTPKTGDINVADADVIASAVVDGINEVAVEIHQGRASSSDIYFAMTYLVFSTDEVVTNEQTDISISMGSDETERNFTWYAPVSGDGTLYIAKENALEDGAMPSTAAAYTVTGASAGKTGYYYYQTTAADLEGGTTYAYQVVNGDIVSDVMTFTTGTEGDFSFVFVGDPQIGAGSTETDIEGWADTLSVIATADEFEDVDFMLSAGDQVQTGNNEELYDGYLNHDTLLSLAVATVIGNHDTNATDATYSEHFNIVNESDEYGTSSAGSDYYYVYNNVLFIVLNSNNTSTAEHKAFMEQVIEETADQDISWRIVTFHHSIYSVASHAVEQAILTRREELVPVFEELGIDVVLMGHDHVYCRTYIMDGLTEVTDASEYDDESYTSVTDPDGILYVTANSASGSKYYSIQTEYDFTYAAVMNQENVPNASRVDVTDDSFTITTYRTTDLSVVDTFTINRTSENEGDQDGNNDDSQDGKNDGSQGDNNDDSQDDDNNDNQGDNNDDSQADDSHTADTLAVRRGNIFYFSSSIIDPDAEVTEATFGKADDDVLVGDWDGDGIDTPAVRRGNIYCFSNSADDPDAEVTKVTFGRSGDEVFVGDWDGDGIDTLAVRRGNVYYFSDSVDD